MFHSLDELPQIAQSCLTNLRCHNNRKNTSSQAKLFECVCFIKLLSVQEFCSFTETDVLPYFPSLTESLLNVVLMDRSPQKVAEHELIMKSKSTK